MRAKQRTEVIVRQVGMRHAYRYIGAEATAQDCNRRTQWSERITALRRSIVCDQHRLPTWDGIDEARSFLQER